MRHTLIACDVATTNIIRAGLIERVAHQGASIARVDGERKTRTAASPYSHLINTWFVAFVKLSFVE